MTVRLVRPHAFSGTPTGLIIAKPNANILYATLGKGPKLNPDDQANSSRHFMRELNRLGLTSIIDAGGGFQNYPEDYQVVDRLHRAGQTPRNIERVKTLGGGIAVQHRMAYQGEYFVERYGAEAAAHTPPIVRMLEMGVPVGVGTDATRVASLCRLNSSVERPESVRAIAEPTPVLKPYLPVRIIARVGEHSGADQKRSKTTPCSHSRVSVGIVGFSVPVA